MGNIKIFPYIIINLKITFRKDNCLIVSINGVEQPGQLASSTSNRIEQPLYLGANIINNVVTRFGKMKLSKFSFKYIPIWFNYFFHIISSITI